MKKKPGKYLKFYYKCMQDGVIATPDNMYCPYGLCFSVIGERGKNPDIDLVKPTCDDLLELVNEEKSVRFWASGLNNYDLGKSSLFTPLRENVVLLLAAMNGEL